MNTLQRAALSAVSGVLYAASFPEIGFGWLIFLAFVPLLVALRGARSMWQSILSGWLSQTVAWLIMVPWVIRVMSHYGGLPYAVGVLLYVAMAIYLGIFGALFGLIVHRFRLGPSPGRWLLVPAAWAALEYARTYLFTGFPWNLVAAAIIDYTPLIQLDRFAGPYFMAFLIVLPSAVIAWMIAERPATARRTGALAGLIALFFIWWGTGLVASKLVARPTGAARIRAALLQPNISQEMRWDESNLVTIFQKMIGMTQEAIAGGARVVVWPESTVPLSYSSTPAFRRVIEELSRQGNADIILGSIAEDPAAPNRMWNAAFLVSGGRTIGHYDKIRLVPFGEYVPLRRVLFFAEKLVRAVGEFQFGTSEQPLRGAMQYGPAICYEIVYPQITRTQVRNGADILVTITNDAWYDGTAAPRQHLDQARLRAIEDDRYILRAATTGISAWIDPTGRIVGEIPMGREGILYADVESRTRTTPYVRFGDWFAWLAVGVVAIGAVRQNS